MQRSGSTFRKCQSKDLTLFPPSFICLQCVCHWGPQTILVVHRLSLTLIHIERGVSRRCPTEASRILPEPQPGGGRAARRWLDIGSLPLYFVGCFLSM